MRKWRIATLILGSAVLVLGGALISTRTALSNAEKQVQTISKTNIFLRQTLGNLTVTVAAKDEEIDRLSKPGCQSPGDSAARNTKELTTIKSLPRAADKESRRGFRHESIVQSPGQCD